MVAIVTERSQWEIPSLNVTNPKSFSITAATTVMLQPTTHANEVDKSQYDRADSKENSHRAKLIPKGFVYVLSKSRTI